MSGTAFRPRLDPPGVPRGYRGSGPMVSGVLRVGAGVILEYPRVGYARGFDSGFGPLHYHSFFAFARTLQTAFERESLYHWSAYWRVLRCSPKPPEGPVELIAGGAYE